MRTCPQPGGPAAGAELAEITSTQATLIAAQAARRERLRRQLVSVHWGLLALTAPGVIAVYAVDLWLHPCWQFEADLGLAIAMCAVVMSMMLSAGAIGQDNPLWLRYPAISPDGQTILFTYKGDIYSVRASGGTAVPLTLSESYEFAPVWSHDGRSIAFASDRYGNFDVFVMPSGGGESTRLTFHSNGEIPSSFTADDRAVLFSAYRQDPASNDQFPISMMSELYSVPVGGGRVSQVLGAVVAAAHAGGSP